MPSSTPPIRPARPTDAEALARLGAQLGYPCDAAEMHARLALLRSNGLGEVLVAVDEYDQPLGWLNVAETRTLQYGTFAEVLGLVVDDAARGRGTGAALMAEAERWAQARGLAEVRVRSNVIRERAHAFYRRLGYAEWKRQVAFRRALVTP